MDDTTLRTYTEAPPNSGPIPDSASDTGAEYLRATEHAVILVPMRLVHVATHDVLWVEPPCSRA